MFFDDSQALVSSKGEGPNRAERGTLKPPRKSQSVVGGSEDKEEERHRPDAVSPATPRGAPPVTVKNGTASSRAPRRLGPKIEVPNGPAGTQM